MGGKDEWVKRALTCIQGAAAQNNTGFDQELSQLLSKIIDDEERVRLISALSDGVITQQYQGVATHQVVDFLILVLDYEMSLEEENAYQERDVKNGLWFPCSTGAFGLSAAVWVAPLWMKDTSAGAPFAGALLFGFFLFFFIMGRGTSRMEGKANRRKQGFDSLREALMRRYEP